MMPIPYPPPMTTVANSTNWAIVSASDASFFPLLRDTVNSIRDKPEGRDVPFIVFDLGLLADQREELADRAIHFITPDWDYRFATPQPDWFKAMTARPHLPKWVPGYDLYFWIDADAWVQRWETVELYLAGAQRLGFAVTAEADRAYSEYVGPAPGKEAVIGVHFRHQTLQAFFGEDVAKKFRGYPLLNCGVFAALATSEIWQTWPQYMRKALHQGKGDPFFAEQTAMNVALYGGEVPFARLPATCNWVVNRAWPIVGVGGELVHPDFPHEPIGIIHRTAITKRMNKCLHALDGSATNIGLNYYRP
ncbi:MAG: hypothetical protein JSR27_13010 [Proteobacteria bacterium]|nr:hypothetical protein [Pseudomonadota bacterium]